MTSVPEPDARTLSWSRGRSKTAANWPAVHEQPWSYFVRWLELDKPAATKEVRPYVGGTLQHGRRSIRTVEQRFFLTLDADYADVDFPLDVADLLTDTPYVIHTTWRHTPEAHRYRLVIPLSRGVEPNEYKILAWTVMNRLDGKRFDVTTAQAERFMWSPSCADPATYFWISANARAPYLPVDEWLEGHHGPPDAPAAGGQGNLPPTPPASRSEAYTAPQPTAEDKERAEEILGSAVNSVLHLHETGEFAGRNEAVFHLMPTLLRFAEAGALDEDLVLDSLFNAAQSVPADEAYTRQEFNASVRSARQYVEETGPALPETTPTKMAQKDFEDVDTEIDLWSRTPQLSHIAQAADAMGRNRLALLAVVLTRVLVEVDPGVCLPGVRDGAIGSRAPLNLGVAMVGASGQGKTTFSDESADVLGRDQTDQTKIPSTGQGLIQSYLYWDSEASENRLIPEPRRLFIVDEIDKLGALSKDQGSTLMAELRTLLSGGTTGSTNARKELDRILHARTYNFQIVIGVQPARAEPLLSGRDAGTPQRFIWVNVTDPKTALHPDKRPEWPGPLDWNTGFLLEFELGNPIVEYPDWLRAELRDYDYQVSLEDAQGGEMSRFGHQNLLRLKVAAGIAFLHESTQIKDEHVEIADQIVAASKRVQISCERVVAEKNFLAQKSRATTDERVRDEVEKDKVAHLLKIVKAKVARAGGEWVSGTDLRLAHRDRAEYTEPVWEALAQEAGLEVVVDDTTGQVKRKARLKK